MNRRLLLRRIYGRICNIHKLWAKWNSTCCALVKLRELYEGRTGPNFPRTNSEYIQRQEIKGRENWFWANQPLQEEVGLVFM